MKGWMGPPNTHPLLLCVRAFLCGLAGPVAFSLMHFYGYRWTGAALAALSGLLLFDTLFKASGWRKI